MRARFHDRILDGTLHCLHSSRWQIAVLSHLAQPLATGWRESRVARHQPGSGSLTMVSRGKSRWRKLFAGGQWSLDGLAAPKPADAPAPECINRILRTAVKLRHITRTVG